MPNRTIFALLILVASVLIALSLAADTWLHAKCKFYWTPTDCMMLCNESPFDLLPDCVQTHEKEKQVTTLVKSLGSLSALQSVPKWWLSHKSDVESSVAMKSAATSLVASSEHMNLAPEDKSHFNRLNSQTPIWTSSVEDMSHLHRMVVYHTRLFIKSSQLALADMNSLFEAGKHDLLIAKLSDFLDENEVVTKTIQEAIVQAKQTEEETRRMELYASSVHLIMAKLATKGSQAETQRNALIRKEANAWFSNGGRLKEIDLLHAVAYEGALAENSLNMTKNLITKLGSFQQFGSETILVLRELRNHLETARKGLAKNVKVPKESANPTHHIVPSGERVAAFKAATSEVEELFVVVEQSCREFTDLIAHGKRRQSISVLSATHEEEDEEIME